MGRSTNDHWLRINTKESMYGREKSVMWMRRRSRERRM
jgi:hypothetical protein